jgi:DnaJ like chaperone protein
MFDGNSDPRLGTSNLFDKEPEREQNEGNRNSFLFSMLVLASYIIRADGRIMHSEMETVRQMLRQNFGEVAVQQGNQILQRLFEEAKRQGEASYKHTIYQSCQQIAAHTNYGERLQLLSFLVAIAQADGKVPPAEVTALKEVSLWLQMQENEIDSMLHLKGDSLDDAYQVLGISPDATDEEVRRAYRRLALEHHPDRVAKLGEDVRRAAEKKFQEINAAKERIYKQRGL